MCKCQTLISIFVNKNTRIALEKYAKVIENEYRKQMIANNLVVSGQSIKQVKTFVTEEAPGILNLKMPITKPLAYVEFGRRRGTPPPIGKIRDWMRARGIEGATDKKTKSIAWKIAQNIGAKGTIKRFGYKGANLSTLVVQSVQKRLISDIRDAYIKDLRDMLNARS